MKSYGSKTEGSSNRVSKDIPMKLVMLGIGIMAIAMWLIPAVPVNLLGAIIIIVFGFFFATVSSRMVGIVGSSNNPVSGMAFATLLITTMILKATGMIGNHGVLDMLVKVVNNPVGHRCHTALRKRGICLIQRCFANHTHLAFVRPCHFQGITHTGNSCTDNEKIILVNHNPLGRAYTAARHNKCKSMIFSLSVQELPV